MDYEGIAHNSDRPEQLSLRLGHKGVTWAGEEMTLRNGFGTKCHGGDRLRAAQKPDIVCSSEVHRRYRCLGNLAHDRRRTRDDMTYSSTFRSEDLGN